LDRILTLITGLIFFLGGYTLARRAFDDDNKNMIESVGFGIVGVLFGAFLLWVAIAGPPDI
jgi:hypothetical protein